jgi:hypothetical protein
MTIPSLIPAPDPLPLPAPAWLLHALLIATFLVHLIFMNGLVGGALLALYSRARARTAEDEHARLAAGIATWLPVLVAGTVTFGVAPLLFLQVLFGQYFFTSSIIMGWTWFAVILILIAAYYGTYIVSFGAERLARPRTILLGLVAFLLLAIALIYTNNTTLMLYPERWGAVYFAHPGGTLGGLGIGMLWPRYLHMILGAVAVAGLLTAWWGELTRARHPAASAFRRDLGLRVFTWLTAVNLAVGVWFLLALERPLRKLMMGGALDATILFGAGFVLAIALLGLVARAKITGRTRDLGGATLVAVATLLAMVLLRDRLRAGALAATGQTGPFAERPQMLNFLLFAVLLTAGLGAVVWMARRLVKGPAPARSEDLQARNQKD